MWCDDLKRKRPRREKKERVALRVNLFEPLAGLKGERAAGKDNVCRQRRAVLDDNAEIFADGVMDWRLKKKKFQRLGAFEPQIVEIGEAAQFWRNFKVRAGICEKNSGIYEIGLAFFLAGAERRNQAARRGEQNP